MPSPRLRQVDTPLILCYVCLLLLSVGFLILHPSYGSIFHTHSSNGEEYTISVLTLPVHLYNLGSLLTPGAVLQMHASLNASANSLTLGTIACV